MHEKISNYIRKEIKRGLAKLTETHHLRFKRMYSYNDLNKPIDEVVGNIPEEKLNWALIQVENSLKKL